MPPAEVTAKNSSEALLAKQCWVDLGTFPPGERIEEQLGSGLEGNQK